MNVGGDGMQLTELELLYLRRLVVEDIDMLERRINKLIRLASHDDQFHKKMALAESELAAMQEIKRKINDEIAVRELITIRD